MPSDTYRAWLREQQKQLASRIPELLSKVPLAFTVREAKATSRDGEPIALGPEATAVGTVGELILVRMSPEQPLWFLDWTVALPVRGLEGKVVRTPIGRWGRRASQWLRREAAASDFVDDFALTAPVGSSRRAWIPEALARSLAQHDDGFFVRRADLINGRGEQCTVCVGFRVVPNPDSVLRSYECADAVCRAWAPSAFARD